MPNDAVEIRFNRAQLARVQQMTHEIPSGFKRVAQGAITRTLTKVKSLTVHILADAAHIKQKNLRRNIYIKRPSFEVLAGFVRFGAGRVPIYEMYARGAKRAGGVSFQGREGRQIIPGAFIATMKSGHIGVFKRKGPKRLPIRELFGPSFWFLWETHPEAREDVHAQAQGELGKQIEDRLKYVLARYGGSAT